MSATQTDSFRPAGDTTGTPVDPASPGGSLIELATEVAGILAEANIDPAMATDLEVSTALLSYQLRSEKSGTNGYASLDGTGKVPVAELPAFPVPAATVVTETAYGQASVVGTAASFAREDHTHGTPAASANYARGFGLFSAAASYVEVTGTSYTAVTAFIFPGTSSGVSPDVIRTILAASSSGNIGVRVYDVTNAQVIVVADPLAVTALPTIYSLGAVGSLPSGLAVFEVQLKKLGSSKPRISYFEIFES